MNLCMDILRLITVKALQDATWCGQRVYDSPAEPADLRLEKERAPYIAVYIDDGDFNLEEDPGVGAASLYDGGGTCWLLIEVSIAGQELAAPERLDPNSVQDPAMQRKEPDATALAYTDAALELRIGLIARQVMDALAEPRSPWANLWRILAPVRGRVEIRRGGSGLDHEQEQGIRYASRVIRMNLGLLGEPVPGPITGFWQDFLTLAATDDQVKGLVPVLREFLGPVAGERDWERVARAGTISLDAVRAIGLGPVVKTLEGEPWEETPPKDSNDGVSFIQES